MGNINTTFFDSLDAAATWSAGVAFKRSKGLPLDKYSVFETKALAEEYAQKKGAYAETPVSYPGQVIAVAEGNKMVAYVLAENAAGTSLELQQIGIIPTGDDKTISVTEDGVISLLATDAQVDETNEAGEATGNKVVNAGAQLVLQSDGTIKWVQPDTSTAEGQAVAISGLQDRMTTAESDIDKIEEKVGVAAEGEKAATGLFKAIANEESRATEAEEALAGRITTLENKEDKDTTYSVKEGEKVLSLDGTAFGTTLKLNYSDNKIKLLGINDVLISEFDASAFVSDGVLEDASYDATTKKITFTWNIVTGTDENNNPIYKTDVIEIGDLVDTYTAGNGLNLNNNEFSVKVTDNDKYLEVDATGVHTKGIDTAIATAKQEAIDAAATDATTKANTAKADAIADTATKLENYYTKSEVYTKDEIAGLDHATKTEVENAVKAEAEIARAAEKANADAIAAIKDSETIDSFADVVSALAGKQDKLTEGAYATESFVEGKVNALATGAVAEAKAQADKGVADAKTAKDAADAAQADANTNALNIQEIEKEINGYTVGEGEEAQQVDGLITKVANNTARIATAEGTITEHTTAIGNNATAAADAQAQADEALRVANTKTTMGEVEAKGYAVAETVNSELTDIKNRLAAEEGKVDNDTTYTFENGTEGTFKVTPKDGQAQVVDTGAKAYVGEAIKDLATREEAQGYADAKVASVTAADASVTISGTTTAPTVAAKLSADADNAITLADDGLKVVIPAAPEYSIKKADDSGEYAAVYNLTKDGVVVGASINIPKDMVVKSGSVVNNEIVLVLNDENSTEIKIPAASLIEYVTSGSATGDMVVVNVSDDHKVTATITDGTVTLTKLTTEVQTAIGKAHTHGNADVINAITADDVEAWNKAEQNAKDYANGLAGNYATAAQGAKADTAIQSVAGGTGLKVTVDATDATKLTVDLDDSVVFVFNGGSADSEW